MLHVADRVIVDTNVFVSALTSARGASREVLRLCFQQRCRPMMGLKLFLEYEDVLGRTELFESSPLSYAERERLFAAFANVSEWVKIYYLWRPNLPDEGDNHLIELAVAGGAGMIITHNVRHFERSELRFPEVRVLRPGDFLRETR